MRGQAGDWSLILKIIRASPTAPDVPEHWNYWKREALAYQSGIPYGLAALGLTAPRLAGVVAEAAEPEQISLLMEDVQNESEPGWTPAEDGLLAERLGQWGALPLREPWLCPGYLRGILRTGAVVQEMVDAKRVWEFPHIAREFPAPMVERIRRLVRESDRILRMLDRLPRVLCHADTHRGNVMRRRRTDGSREFVVIDWSTLGVGAVGEEIGHQFSTNILTGAVPVARAGDLAETLIAGYVRGSGADEAAVRCGFTATVALRSFGFALPLILRAGSDPDNAEAVAYAPRLGAAVRALLPYLDAALAMA